MVDKHNERQKKILALVDEHGFVATKRLVNKFNVRP